MFAKSPCFGAVFGLLLLALVSHSAVAEDSKHTYQNTGNSNEIDSQRSKKSGVQFCEVDDDVCHAHAKGEAGGTASTGSGRKGVNDSKISRAMDKDRWDRNGYVTFCPCMGNFGNQVELYLGSIAFAKAVNRTLILPPFTHVSYRGKRVHIAVPYTDLFQLGAIREFHRAIPMEDFLERLAPKYWPPGKRKIYSYTFKDMDCEILQNLGYFWKDLKPPVEFDECVVFNTMRNIHADLGEEKSVVAVKNALSERFPPRDHPVLALAQSPGTFPMLAGNRRIQKYIQWTEESFAEAKAYIAESFGEDSWVAVHLRNGGDWVKACEPDIETKAFVMASTQCHDKNVGAVTKDMCLPSIPHMLELTLQVFQDVKAQHLFIATDKHPHIQEFRTLLDPLEVSVHHLDPSTPQVDLMILGQANYFIGTCTSSFTSFVKRERDASGRPSIFWGQEYKGF